jgi:hypothetical protein
MFYSYKCNNVYLNFLILAQKHKRKRSKTRIIKTLLLYIILRFGKVHLNADDKKFETDTTSQIN